MNPVLMLTHNNLELTKRTLASVEDQDVPIRCVFVDNGSTDGTYKWIRSVRYAWISNHGNAGVSRGWNQGLHALLHNPIGPDRVLVINNDVVLPPWFYSELLSYDLPFVSGVSVNNMEQIAEKPPKGPLNKHPDFSAFLIRREAWEKVGPFDESMKHYASDNDWHVRAHRAGVQLWKANLPFYHERSSTLKLASPEERAEIETQANKDRAVFKAKYGCLPWDKEYDALFAGEA